jgi:BirA family transcriptional regulator, biotin operon repressor / biotin---[acetyl-CoA-carboxylase] ligase
MSASELHGALVEALARLPKPPHVIASELVCVDETGSTNDLARAAAESGCADGATFIADSQTAGRGRGGRTWLSAPGDCVLLSVVLRQPIPAGSLGALTMLGACAAASAIEANVGISCELKWPNDVQIAGRKVAGVLVESSLLGDSLQYAVVGIGVNLKLDTGALLEIRGTATSIEAETGRPVDRVGFTAELLRQMDQRYDSLARGGSRLVFDEWRSRLSTLGQHVVLTDADGLQLEMDVTDVAPDGSLIGRRPDGSRIVAMLGDVTVRPA